MNEKYELLRELLDFQKSLEKQKNTDSRRFTELKMRKLLEFAQTGKWNYKNNEGKVPRVGTIEEALHGTDIEATNIAKRDE